MQKGSHFASVIGTANLTASLWMSGVLILMLHGKLVPGSHLCLLTRRNPLMKYGKASVPHWKLPFGMLTPKLGVLDLNRSLNTSVPETRSRVLCSAKTESLNTLRPFYLLWASVSLATGSAPATTRSLCHWTHPMSSTSANGAKNCWSVIKKCSSGFAAIPAHRFIISTGTAPRSLCPLFEGIQKLKEFWSSIWNRQVPDFTRILHSLDETLAEFRRPAAVWEPLTSAELATASIRPSWVLVRVLMGGPGTT